MKSPKLISISGAIHSGKTTVSRMLAYEMPNAAYLDGDLVASLVRQNHPPDATIDEILPDVHKMIADIIRASLVRDTDIIVDYPITDDTREEIEEVLVDVEYSPKWFLLRPNIDKVLKGSKTRPVLSDWEIERIKYHYSSLLVETELATIIDSTNQTPEETVGEIEKIINE